MDWRHRGCLVENGFWFGHGLLPTVTQAIRGLTPRSCLLIARSLYGLIRLGALSLGLVSFSASAQAPSVSASNDEVVLSADRLDYDAANEVAVARGNVELIQNGQVLLADELIYDTLSGRVRAQGNIVMTDTDGNVLFADTFDVTDDLSDGVMADLSFLLTDGAQIRALQGQRLDGRVTILDRAVYSPCEICEDSWLSPLWQIRAERAVHDQDNQTVTYRNATMDFLGLPVLYTPYFSHPDPTVDRRTGFLVPSFGTDSELGFTLETPFHIVLASNEDVTLTPLITSGEGMLLDADYRHLSAMGRTNIGGSITYTSAAQLTEDDDRSKEARGRVYGEGRYTLDEKTVTGFDLSLSSDNTFLDRYGFSGDDVLENRVFVERYDGRDFLGLNNYAFQGRRIGDDQGLIPFVLPWLESETVRPTGLWGSTIKTEASFLSLARTEGLDTRRVSGGISAQLPHVGKFGELYTFEAGLRGDVYNVDGDPQDRSGSDGLDTTARVVPFAHAELRWPLIGTQGEWQHVIEPVVTASWTGGNVNKDSIPNEDSLEFEFDETNLFERDRFTGLDRVESGAKLSYGIKFDSVAPNGVQIGGVFGQSVRNGPDGLFEEGSGLEDPLSDYVGRLSLRPSRSVNLNYRFRLAKDEAALRRSDLKLSFGPPRLRMSLQYIRLTEELTALDIDDREEVTASVQLRLTEGLSVGAKIRRDIEQGRPVSNSFGLVYTNSCLVVTAGIERSFTERGELEDETRFTVKLGFRSLGDVEASSNSLF